LDLLREEGMGCIMRSFITCTLHQILLGDQIKEDEMDSACSTDGREVKYIRFFGLETKREETT
jgi:hypothetical protein